MISNGAMTFKRSNKTPRRIFQGLPRFSDPRQPVLTIANQQWYENDYGGELLTKLVNTFNNYGVTVSMSRCTNSHDMTFELDNKLLLHFPRTFPDQEPSFSLVNHKVSTTRDPQRISNTLVEHMIKVLDAI